MSFYKRFKYKCGSYPFSAKKIVDFLAALTHPFWNFHHTLGSKPTPKATCVNFGMHFEIALSVQATPEELVHACVRARVRVQCHNLAKPVQKSYAKHNSCASFQ